MVVILGRRDYNNISNFYPPLEASGRLHVGVERKCSRSDRQLGPSEKSRVNFYGIVCNRSASKRGRHLPPGQFFIDMLP